MTNCSEKVKGARANFDDQLDVFMGYFRFKRRGRSFLALGPLALSGLQLTYAKARYPLPDDEQGLMNAHQHESSLQETHLAVMDMPTIHPPVGLGAIVAFSRYRQDRILRRLEVSETAMSELDIVRPGNDLPSSH